MSCSTGACSDRTTGMAVEAAGPPAGGGHQRSLDQPGFAPPRPGTTWVRGGPNRRLPRALATYDGVEESASSPSASGGRLQLDRCEVLLAVRLIPERGSWPKQAAEELTASPGTPPRQPKRCCSSPTPPCSSGEAGVASATAEQAGRAFRRQQRPGWQAQAQLASPGPMGGGRSQRRRPRPRSRRARRHSTPSVCRCWP